MNLPDLIGSLGVTILLIAFLLNLLKKVSQDSHVYILLNIIGAGLACAASILINYIPFIILEAVWTIVSLASWFRVITVKKTK